MRLTLILLLSYTLVYAQYDHQSVLPDLEDAALAEALVSEYKPATVIDFRNVKDTLYKNIYLHRDSVRCVYTGMAKYLDLDADPSEFLFQNGGNEDINLEHCYPQSKGARSGNPQADMHHLFPSRVPVNSARASDPYRELPDNQTERWYYKTLTQSNTPSSNIGLYSEDNDNGFEPRDDFKGNVARAYFYFYTMYQAQADAEDPEFFEEQLSTLCDWHQADPVDSLEWERNFKIAAYQDGKPNPFILDCRLARLYCGNFSNACQLVPTLQVERLPITLVNSTVAAGQDLLLEGAGLNDKLQSLIFTLEGRVISDTIINPSGHITAPSHAGMYLLVIKNAKLPLLTKRIVVF